MPRPYRMGKRAEERDETRERILKATMQLHDEQGVAPTTFSQIAERAGVGPATVSRHFPRIGDLVRSCGMHVWQEMRPPVPDAVAAVFAGLTDRAARTRKLLEEVDAFYSRGALRLRLAARDRELIPELHGFLSAVEGGVQALVREALPEAKEPALNVAFALTSFPVWSELQQQNLPRDTFFALWTRLIETGMDAV